MLTDFTSIVVCATALVLVCSADDPFSRTRVNSFWLPLFDKLRIHVPVVLAINKSPVAQSNHLSRQFWPLVHTLKLASVRNCKRSFDDGMKSVCYEFVDHKIPSLGGHLLSICA